MKFLVLLSVLFYPLTAKATTFVGGKPSLFGIRGGGADKSSKKSTKLPPANDDYARAERAIFRGIETVEQKLQQAVEDEVHSIFDEADHHHRAQVAEHAKTAVQKGSSRIKEAAKEHSKARFLPFLPKEVEEEEHDDHKILHAVEAAEKAVLHAVQDEVDSLFHDIHHDEDHPLKGASPKATKKGKEGIQKGLEKTKKHVEESHKERKRWMNEKESSAIDEYLKSTNSLQGMGF